MEEIIKRLQALADSHPEIKDDLEREVEELREVKGIYHTEGSALTVKPPETIRIRIKIPNHIMQWALDKMGWNEGEHDGLMEAADNFFKETITKAYEESDALSSEYSKRTLPPTYTELELPFKVRQWAYEGLLGIEDIADNEDPTEPLENYFRRLILRAYNRDIGNGLQEGPF